MQQPINNVGWSTGWPQIGPIYPHSQNQTTPSGPSTTSRFTNAFSNIVPPWAPGAQNGQGVGFLRENLIATGYIDPNTGLFAGNQQLPQQQFMPPLQPTSQQIALTAATQQQQTKQNDGPIARTDAAKTVSDPIKTAETDIPQSAWSSAWEGIGGWQGLQNTGKVIGALGDMYLGFKNYNLTKDQLDEANRQWNANYEASRKTTNTAILDRQAARRAAGGSAYADPNDPQWRKNNLI